MIYHIRSKREGITNRLAKEHKAMLESLGYEIRTTLSCHFIECDSIDELQKKIGLPLGFDSGLAMLTIFDE